MKRKRDDLPYYTWDQATILNLWSPAAFQGVGISADRIRQWASRDHVSPAGKGPNGCLLYPYDEVVKIADRATRRIA